MNRVLLLKQIIAARYGGNVAAFARAIGKAGPQVHQWLSGHRLFGDDGARHVELTLKLPMGYFDKNPEETARILSDPDAALVAPNVEPGPTLYGPVPLISWVHAGDPAEAIDPLQPGEAEDWIPSLWRVSRHAYALRVRGDSMMPTYAPGAIIIVEPEDDWRDGQHVIAKNGDGEAVFRKLVKEGGDWWLVPLNPAYNPPRLLGDYHVVGVVRGGIIQAP